MNVLRRELRFPCGVLTAADLTQHGWLYFERRAPGAPMRCRISAAKTVAGGMLVILAAGVTRDTVSGLRGMMAVWPAAALPRMEVDYGIDVGWRVLGPRGEALGRVTELFSGPANDAFRVARTAGGHWVLPAIDVVITRVEPEAGVLVVSDDVADYAVEEP